MKHAFIEEQRERGIACGDCASCSRFLLRAIMSGEGDR